MRLKNIYKTLKEIQPVIANTIAEKSSNSSSEYVIKDWNEVLKALEKIKHIKIYKDVGQELFNISPIFGEKVENLKITSSQAGKFNKWINKIKSKNEVIIDLCESIGYGENIGSFEVKLPETNDLGEFSSNINNLNKVFQLCPFTKTDNSSIKLTKTDIGSTWLEFNITGDDVILILTALGYFVQSALKIKSMYLTCEKQKEEIRGVQIKNNLAEEITNVYKNMIKTITSKEVRNLEDTLEKPLEPEERNSAEKSMEILGNLMSKGLEIYATLDSPQKAKDVFPSSKEQKMLPTYPKMLSSNSEKD